VGHRHQRRPDAPDIVTLGEAAASFEMTRRWWDKGAKVSPHRHPVDGSRVYRRGTVLDLRKELESGAST
jgi:hypothetical protein